MSDDLIDVIRVTSGIVSLLNVMGECGVGGDSVPEALIFLAERLQEQVHKLDNIEKEVRGRRFTDD